VRIMAIDPGVADTGVVLFDKGEFLAVKHLKTKASKNALGQPTGDPFRDVIRRVREQVVAVARLHDEWKPDLVAVESYEDFGPHLREAKGRWMTPVLIGSLDTHFWGIDVEVCYQSPRRKPEAKLCHMNGVLLYVGQGLLTNGHLQDAARHAIICQRDNFFTTAAKGGEPRGAPPRPAGKG
jgi:hypothetical protein